MPTYTHRLVLILATVLALAGCGQQPVGPATDAVWQSVRDGDLPRLAKRDDSAAAEFLIEHGARLNQVCEYGTPLDLTANCEIAEVLRIAGGAASSDKSIASRTHDNYLTPLPSEK